MEVDDELYTVIICHDEQAYKVFEGHHCFQWLPIRPDLYRPLPNFPPPLTTSVSSGLRAERSGGIKLVQLLPEKKMFQEGKWGWG